MQTRTVLRGSTICLEIEEKGKIKTLRLKEEQVCWEGLRKLRGEFVRGVPRRNNKDCLKYCCCESCDLT